MRAGRVEDQRLLGRVLDDRYRIESFIARGGIATIYRGADLRLERTVAIKVMHPSFTSDPGFVDRFEREARVAARLNTPYAVGVHDQGNDAGVTYLVMEYVPGHTVRDVLGTHGALHPAQALAIIDPVLEALAAAHRAGYIHRDVKPENVLISEDGRVKVTDFGLARAIEGADSGRTHGLLLGNVAYLSPEQVEHDRTDARSDVYSAGILLFELVTGQVPFSAAAPMQVAYKHVNEDVPVPSSVRAGIPAGINELVRRATRRRPDDPYPDAAAFLAEVRALRATLPDAAPWAQAPTENLGVAKDALPPVPMGPFRQPPDLTAQFAGRLSGPRLMTQSNLRLVQLRFADPAVRPLTEAWADGRADLLLSWRVEAGVCDYILQLGGIREGRTSEIMPKTRPSPGQLDELVLRFDRLRRHEVALDRLRHLMFRRWRGPFTSWRPEVDSLALRSQLDGVLRLREDLRAWKRADQTLVLRTEANPWDRSPLLRWRVDLSGRLRRTAADDGSPDESGRGWECHARILAPDPPYVPLLKRHLEEPETLSVLADWVLRAFADVPLGSLSTLTLNDAVLGSNAEAPPPTWALNDVDDFDSMNYEVSGRNAMLWSLTTQQGVEYFAVESHDDFHTLTWSSELSIQEAVERFYSGDPLLPTPHGSEDVLGVIVRTNEPEMLSGVSAYQALAEEPEAIRLIRLEYPEVTLVCHRQEGVDFGVEVGLILMESSPDLGVRALQRTASPSIAHAASSFMHKVYTDLVREP